MTDQSDSSTLRFCRLTLPLIGSLLLPLILGVFTVVIILHEQNIAVEQHVEDRSTTSS
jgi:hypothetical protein